jgi:serine/threonine protein kinase
LQLQVKNLDKNGLDLLDAMLTYDPAARIIARDALLHSYFDDLDKRKLPAV